MFIKRFWISLLFSFFLFSFALKVRFYSNFLSLRLCDDDDDD